MGLRGRIKERTQPTCLGNRENCTFSQAKEIDEVFFVCLFVLFCNHKLPFMVIGVEGVAEWQSTCQVSGGPWVLPGIGERLDNFDPYRVRLPT